MIFCKPSPGRAPAHGPEFPVFTSTPIFLQKSQILPVLPNFPKNVKYLQVALSNFGILTNGAPPLENFTSQCHPLLPVFSSGARTNRAERAYAKTQRATAYGRRLCASVSLFFIKKILPHYIIPKLFYKIK